MSDFGGHVRRGLHNVSLIPRNAGVVLLLLYRRFVSPIYGDVLSLIHI